MRTLDKLVKIAGSVVYVQHGRLNKWAVSGDGWGSRKIDRIDYIIYLAFIRYNCYV